MRWEDNYTHRGPDLAKLNDMGRDFLPNAPQGWTKVDVSRETFCPEFFLQQLFLLPIRIHHPSGRSDSAQIDFCAPQNVVLLTVRVGVLCAGVMGGRASAEAAGLAFQGLSKG